MWSISPDVFTSLVVKDGLQNLKNWVIFIFLILIQRSPLDI